MAGARGKARRDADDNGKRDETNERRHGEGMRRRRRTGSAQEQERTVKEVALRLPSSDLTKAFGQDVSAALTCSQQVKLRLSFSIYASRRLSCSPSNDFTYISSTFTNHSFLLHLLSNLSLTGAR